VASILKVVQVGHPVLRQRSRPLSAAEVRSPGIIRLIEDMRETMRDAPGVGLAAPQIGHALQLFVIEDKPEFIERMAPDEVEARGRVPIPFQVLVNPRLTFIDRSPSDFFEGCLSFADFMMVVPRAQVVRVEALDHHAKPISLTWEGWPARILQHETDHLHGVLCLDRMRSRTLTSVRNHARYWQGAPVAVFLETIGNSPETDAAPIEEQTARANDDD
jgi:peptide deformylase